MHPLTDHSSPDPREGDALPIEDVDLTTAFDPERLLLGDHGGVMVIVGLLVLALILLTVAFGALPR
ncbi:hypothetical protein [Williamsia deligens]|uniref:Uncharacterized protein n=1 Tax=Williamsia deligens TaxID=321325 RepID=A0ABW3GAP8_9NOCA|nr:hypothetical protein [Williamsia deligens]MCP2193363.1 hypothetical protein [Williamsia deligens]